jgi:hypothetical protein
MCPACAKAMSGVTLAGCRDCSLRELARGPEFFKSMCQNGPTPAYHAALVALGRPTEVHKEVEAVAKTLLVGAAPA